MASRKRVFNAVFPSYSQASAPTPTSTPQLGSAPFGGASSFSLPDLSPARDVAAERIKWERCWHNATSFLSLPSLPIPIAAVLQNQNSLRGQWINSCPLEVSSSILYLVSEKSEGYRLRANNQHDDLLNWYLQEVGQHYVKFERPQLLTILDSEEKPAGLPGLVEHLEVLRAVYLYRVEAHISPHTKERGSYDLTKFQERYDAIVAESLSHSSFPQHLRQYLQLRGRIIVDIRSAGQVDEDAMKDDWETEWTKTRSDTLKMMRSINEVGLGGAQAQRIFAEVMSDLLTEHINTTYAGLWRSSSVETTDTLYAWVEDRFAKFAVEVLACLSSRDIASQSSSGTQVSAVDLNNWKQRATSDLGALRIRELFEIVVDWDNDTEGAIKDLKHYATTTATRSYLTSSFSAVLSQRLLQPGASTTEILQIYICIIRAFAVLDPKGVLLDRLARPIRRYLRDRDDTARIIVGGLLAEDTDDPTNTDALVELAVELNKVTNISGTDDDDGETDWDDMNWVPDPVDAGPGIHDVIGTLISLFDTKDIFVKEFQDILGERLLKTGLNFDKETRVLELLKIRFGDPPLQACEVMLKDILDSRRTDSLVQKREQTSSSPSILHARILSRLFWPPLATDTFLPPPEIALQQALYASAFEAIKPTRKLTWLPTLGTVTVDLTFSDRHLLEDVHTWQATVIHAFDDAANPAAPHPISKSVPQLAAQCAMPEPRVQSALAFWVGKLVLREARPGVYAVLETLTNSDVYASSTATQASLAAAQAAAASTAEAVRSAESRVEERMEEFWPYVVGMLTNQGAMPAPRIVMMLKMAVPGGFPFGKEELKEFMRGKVGEGRVEMQGGSYRMVK
ncbi:hypothetical protein MMC13_002865 [Lambiella insularis]|nr:hypothetical protein [Lambiella insularis]